MNLKSNFASCHGVAELGLVVDEGHQSHVGLDEQRPLQHQHAAGPPGRRALLVGFLHRLDELRFKVLQLKEKNHLDVLPLFSKSSSKTAADVELWRINTKAVAVMDLACRDKLYILTFNLTTQ